MIEARGLTKYYREVTALDHLDLTVGRGEIYALLGPNGAGKTTTLRILAGVLEPDGGSVTICGDDPDRNPIPYRQHLGYLADDTALYKRMTPREMFLFFGAVHEIEADTLQDQIEKVVDLMEIADMADRPIRKLSSGQKQRVNLARVFLHDPDVLLLDEATANLDIIGRRFVMDILLEARKRGKAIILSTHIMSEAESVCDRIGLIHQGRLIDEGTREDLLDRSDAESLADAFFKRIPHEQ